MSRAITRAVHCLRPSPLLLLPGPPSSNTCLVPTLHNHPILSIDPSVACFCQFARHQLGDVHLSLPTVDMDLSPLLCDFASMPSIADPNPKAKHDRLVERHHRISGARAVMIRAYIMRTCLVALDLPLYPCLLATGVLLPTTHLLRPGPPSTCSCRSCCAF